MAECYSFVLLTVTSMTSKNNCKLSDHHFAVYISVLVFMHALTASAKPALHVADLV